MLILNLQLSNALLYLAWRNTQTRVAQTHLHVIRWLVSLKCMHILQLCSTYFVLFNLKSNQHLKMYICSFYLQCSHIFVFFFCFPLTSHRPHRKQSYYLSNTLLRYYFTFARVLFILFISILCMLKKRNIELSGFANANWIEYTKSGVYCLHVSLRE